MTTVEEVPGPSEAPATRSNACRHVDAEPSDVVLSKRNLAGMRASSNLDPEDLHRLDER